MNSDNHWHICPEAITNLSSLPIARGGFGEVYTASYYGSDVAVKVLFRSHNEQELANFNREISIWFRLNHPNILPLLGACDADDKHYMVSPLMQNGSLYRYLSNPQTNCSIRDRLQLMYQAASGMAYLHGKNVIHGDLKSMNVLLDKSFNAVISDFGMSRTKASASVSRRMASRETAGGTLDYMAPEMLDDESPTGSTKATDVYAFGIMLFEVFNSCNHIWTAIDGSPMRDSVIERQVCRGNRPKRLANIPDDIWALIELCWHQNAVQRPAFTRILDHLQPYKSASSDLSAAPQSGIGIRLESVLSSRPSSTSNVAGVGSGYAYSPADTRSSRLSTSDASRSQSLERLLSDLESLDSVPGPILAQTRQGDPAACLEVARIVAEEVTSGRANWSSAAQLFKISADQGNLEASFQMGWLCFTGMGISKNDRSALWYWKQVHDRSRDVITKPIATFMLGWCHYLGRGTSADPRLGLELIKQSKTSEFTLGEGSIHTECVIPLDTAIARKFFELCQAGSEHDWLCKTMVAVCALNGFGTPMDRQRAAQIFDQVAAQGHGIGEYWLGRCYDWGWGLPQSRSTAYRWYLAVARRGDSYGQNMVGRCYQEGCGVSQDHAIAVEWYRKSAEQGNSYGQNSLGDCYWSGQGTAQSSAEAIEWYQKSAQQGNIRSLNFLGICYETGRAVKQDGTLALQLYTRAAEQGYWRSQWNLALCYDYAKGTPRNVRQAIFWYRQIKGGVVDLAMQQLQRIENGGTGNLQHTPI